MQPLELLAPAKNLECGIAAIQHGADAVYIGAVSHGARAAAGNSIEDIKALCDYAHHFLAKVYVTVNTIVYDDELDEIQDLLTALEEAAVDAILVQDMAILEMARKMRRERHITMELHASTQTDNRYADKVSWLARQGFSRVVLARELSMDDIAAIHHQTPDVQLEAFVHGALCVSFSGVCYASQHCFRRSANRGECAQFCRLKFELVDADGQTVDKPRYWLSLKDLCRVDSLGQMAEAGVTSFKIEGRLKDVDYVKNVVAAYRQRLDQVIAHANGRWCRQSLGNCTYSFTPHLQKTFNRGFTTYFIDGHRKDIASVDTPKAMGEYVGKVREIRRDSFNVAGTATFANGDGLCFFDKDGTLRGFRVNRCEGNRIYPLRMPVDLRKGMGLYRNSDTAFEKKLAGKSAERRIPVNIHLQRENHEVVIRMTVVDTDIHTTTRYSQILQPAQKSQEENVRRQLSKLGTTNYVAVDIRVSPELSGLFIPSSVLSEWRRDAVEKLDRLLEKRAVENRRQTLNHQETPLPMPTPALYAEYNYMYNVSNRLARDFYTKNGQEGVGVAFELTHGGRQRRVIMQCRHCVRHLMGYCSKDVRKIPWREPLSLRLPDGRSFQLGFDCGNCQMLVYAE